MGLTRRELVLNATPGVTEALIKRLLGTYSTISRICTFVSTTIGGPLVHAESPAAQSGVNVAVWQRLL